MATTQFTTETYKLTTDIATVLINWMKCINQAWELAFSFTFSAFDKIKKCILHYHIVHSQLSNLSIH